GGVGGREEWGGLGGFVGAGDGGGVREEHGEQVRGQPLATQEVSAAPAALLDQPRFRGLSRQGQVHLLLSAAPLPRVGEVYRVVFERLLGERVSTSPVAVNTAAR